MFPKSKLVKLQTAYNTYEKVQLRALLDEAGIGYQVRSRGPGQYLQFIAGYNLYADDFFVAEDDLTRAQAVIEGFSFTDDDREVIVLDEHESQADDEQEPDL